MLSMLVGNSGAGTIVRKEVENFSLALYFFRAWHILSVLIRTMSVISLGGLNIFPCHEVD